MGRLSIATRSRAGVSPERTQARISRSGSPAWANRWRMPSSGTVQIELDVIGERFEWRDIDDASVVGQAAALARPSRVRSSITARKAASVLPDPVGAAMRVGLLALIAGQALACGGVGSPRAELSQPATTG